MNIQIVTDKVDIIITEAAHEEAMDALALLINSGVIPSEDTIFIEEDEDEECDGCCDCACDCEEEDNSFPFLSIQDILAQALEEAEKELQAEEAKKQEEVEEEIPEEVKEVLSILAHLGVLK